MGTASPLNGASLPRARAILVSGFICVGKTYFAKKYADPDSKYHVIDLDSASFTAKTAPGRFPDNYFEAIRKLIFEDGDLRPKIILLSTHDLARVMLIELGIPFALVYPHVSLEKTWMERITGRDISEQRARLLAPFFEAEHLNTGKSRFSAFATQCWHEKGKSEDRLRHFVLQPRQYLCDVMDDILVQMGNHEIEWEWPALGDVEATARRVRAIIEVRQNAENALAVVEKDWTGNMDENVVEKMAIQKQREAEERRKRAEEEWAKAKADAEAQLGT